MSATCQSVTFASTKVIAIKYQIIQHLSPSTCTGSIMQQQATAATCWCSGACGVQGVCDGTTSNHDQ